MPKVSIIVPVYNVEKYLRKCLDSLVNQTLKDIEIIIINDSSPDNSDLIIKEYEEKYPDIIKSYLKPNGGIANTRNFGLSKVTGEYFGFLDSDDYAKLDMFEKLYQSAKENDSDMVVSNFIWKYDDKEVNHQEGPYKAGKDVFEHIFTALWNKIYRTETIRQSQVLFPDGLRYEDTSFLYRIIPSIKTVSFVDEYFVYYVQRQGSITHTHNSRVKDMIEVFEGIIHFYKENNLYDEYRNQLEYIFLKFFLGNSYLRACQINDKEDRKYTLSQSWDLLHKHFPGWKKNPILRSKQDNKHRFFRLINKFSYYAFAEVLKYKKN